MVCALHSYIPLVAMTRLLGGDDRGFLALLGSMGCFVVTALLFKRLGPPRCSFRDRQCPACGAARETRQRRRRCEHYGQTGADSSDDVGDDVGDDDDDSEDSTECWYRTRRLRDRLSFHQDLDNHQEGAAPTTSNCRPERPEVEDELGGPHAHDSLDYFYPKNSNWNHFEPFCADDSVREQGSCAKLSVGGPLQGGRGSDVRRSHQYLEGEQQSRHDRAIADDAASDDVSLTSENQFVWTTARYSPSRRRPCPDSSTSHLATVPSQHDIEETEPVAAAWRPWKIPWLRRSLSLDDRAAAAKGTNDDRDTSEAPSHTLTRQLKDQSRRLSRSAPASRVSSPHPVRRHRTQSHTDARQSEAAWRSTSLEGAFHRGPSARASAGSSAPERALRRSSEGDARASYNARIMPHGVVLVRHGQSMGNVNECLYGTTPDNAMPLTELGWEQARTAGRLLRHTVLQRHRSDSSSLSSAAATASGGTVHFIVSPYVRAVETFHGMASAWCDPCEEFAHIVDRDVRLRAWYGRLLDMGLTWHEDPRIREQDFGNYQDPEAIRRAKRDRHRFGAFYYRFPHGESASDVFDRISTFLDSLWRSFDANKSRHYVIVTHGIAIRVLLARYFRYTIEQFHTLSNPRNCEMVVLDHDGHGRLQMGGRYELECTKDDGSEEYRVAGYRYHKRLRVLPSESINRVKIRISYND